MIPPWLFYAFFAWMLHGYATQPAAPPPAPTQQEAAP